MIKASTIQNEYYFGDLPGSLQYNVSAEELGQLQFDAYYVEDDRGFQFCEHSLENLRRVLPHTKNHEDWKIILMMKKEMDDGNKIWLKAALLHKSTGQVALLTSTNSKENIELGGHRAIRSIEGTWFVGHYRMSAPVIFWKELRNRMLY
jgi:hypothetical protein